VPFVLAPVSRSSSPTPGSVHASPTLAPRTRALHKKLQGTRAFFNARLRCCAIMMIVCARSVRRTCLAALTEQKGGGCCKCFVRVGGQNLLCEVGILQTAGLRRQQGRAL
jgi:hypothetical protein